MNKILFHGTAYDMTIQHMERHGEFDMKIRHFHAEYEIYYLIQGERYYFINNTTYPVKQGSLVFINQHQIHKTMSPQSEHISHERVLFSLPTSFLDRINAMIPEFHSQQFFADNFGVLSLPLKEQKLMNDIVSSLEYELSNEAPYYEHIALMKMAELLLLAKRAIEKTDIAKTISVPSTVKHEKVDLIAQYITTHYDQPISLPLLAKECYVSKYYLCRIFKEVTGLTVIEYTNLIRIQTAQKLLRKTEKSITEIAHICGFDNITYFQRVFKNYIGSTPLHYRKQTKLNVPVSQSATHDHNDVRKDPVI